MEEENKESVENAGVVASTPATSGIDASAAGKEAANEMKDEMARTFATIKGAGIAGIFGFKAFYFPVIARILWILAIILVVLFSCLGIVLSFFNGVTNGIVTLFLAPLGAVVYLVIIRIWFELVLIAFRINDGIQQMNEKMK